MSEIKVDVILPESNSVDIESPTQDLSANLIILNQNSVDVTSPTQALAANVIIPGPEGPRGEKGDKGERGDSLTGVLGINNLSGNISITGADGIQILATENNILVVSGNSGYFQGLIDELFNTGRFLSGSLEVFGSGLFRLGVKVGTDSVLITPNNIFIEGDPVVTNTKFIQLSGYFENENTIGFIHNLAAGNDNYFISYPNVLASTPRSVNCVFQNPVDDLIYYFSLGGINPTGFYINFSDTLNNNGYYLNINIKK